MSEHATEIDAFEVRCPECGTDVTRLPPCRICGYIHGCCPCYHADASRPIPPGSAAPVVAHEPTQPTGGTNDG